MFFKRSNSSHEAKEDSELLNLYRQKGDLEYLGILFNRYMHLVYGLCLKYLKHREEARDATMEIFEKLVDESLKHEITSFKSWLYVLSKNHCLMQLRKTSSRDKSISNFQKDMEPVMESDYLLHHNSDTDLESDLEALKKCIDELREEQKACVKLFFLQEKSYRQIVEELGMDSKKVKSHIQNGRRNLKICLEKKNG
jgi:RNA polymerase sigma-70 factor (ECF subfamily)